VAAPEYVPQPPVRHVRSYESPPRRPEPWFAERPGELDGGFRWRERFGAPGPDQGYVYVLARRFRDRLTLAPDEDVDDAIAGCAAVALKRASLFGRAPVVHDLTVAFTIWGFLGDAPPDLIAFRQPLFAGVSNPHHYPELRRIADLVPDEVLRRTPQQVADAHRANGTGLLKI
jgi:hypothetical protein